MFDTWFEGQKAKSLDWLQTLHRYPEVGFEEVRTAQFVAKKLSELGYEVETGIGGTGVVASLTKGNDQDSRHTIGFRAELDALPMSETAAIEYSSKIPHRFHGCGHDGHMVTALTAAAYLAEQGTFCGTVRFIFQPAEELLEGARAMIGDGLFERFPCDEIYALHNIPGLPVGHVCIPQDVVLASSDNIDVKIHANGTHGSAPQTGEDAILAAASFVTTIQQLATRVIDTRSTGVISFGVCQGGSARNILPECVTLEGTMRTHSKEVRDRLATLIKDVAASIEISHRVRITVTVDAVAPVTCNHPLGVEAVRRSAQELFGTERVMEKTNSLMASEDFSEMLRLVPGAYFFIGQDGRYPHHPDYVFDPNVIPIGAQIFADLAQKRCAKQP
ncbi:MAG: amidohydrolase [Thalassospira sp.]|uniref:amidohydrolase n=1 Tax=Thalassospira sp. TaxID=1912094 RepID=UPI0032EB6FC3